MEFEWDEGNAPHLLRHGVTPEDAEEALTDPRRRPISSYQIEGQPQRFAVLGATDAGRVLFVVYQRNSTHVFRVISAWDAEPAARRRYRRNK